MIKFFLLAAGYGKRARPLSLIKPKPLFPICGVPLIELVLEQLKKKGLTSGFVNLFYKSDEILNLVNNRCSITFFHEKRLSGSRILNKAAAFLDQSLLLVINGDVLVDLPLAAMKEKIEKSKADGILLVRKFSKGHYSSLIYRHDKYCGVGKISRKGIMYAGVALFRSRVIEKIKESSFFLTLDKYNFDIRLHFYDGIWLDIGDPLSYYRANYEYKQYLKYEKKSADNIKSRNVNISKDSRVENTIIWENTTIINKSVIQNSIITGNLILDRVNFFHKIITNSEVYDL